MLVEQLLIRNRALSLLSFFYLLNGALALLPLFTYLLFITHIASNTVNFIDAGNAGKGNDQAIKMLPLAPVKSGPQQMHGDGA